MTIIKHLRQNVIAYVALFLALTAGAYAAGLKKNSVGSKQIKTGAVKEAELADGAVTAGKVANGAIGGAKLADGSVGTAKLAEGAVTGAKLGGGSVSGASLIDGAVTGAKLADGAVTGAKVAAGSLSGAQIDEGSLGAVPSAADASTVGGVEVKSFTEAQETPSPEVDVVTVGDLTLTLACTEVSGVIVNARTAVNNASLQSILLDAAGNAEAFVNQEDWDTGTTLAIVPGGADAANLIGSLRYRTSEGKAVTVEFASDAVGSGCQVFGTAVGS